jgi:hypothetical protein
MNIGSILKKLTPTRATVAGIGEGYSDFTEREAKRGKTMATQQFVAAFQRAQTSGDPEDIRRVIEDPSHLNADPRIRANVLNSYQNIQNRQANQIESRDLALRRIEGASDEDWQRTQLKKAELEADDFEVTLSDASDNLLPSGRYGAFGDKPIITKIAGNPYREKMKKFKLQQAEAATGIKQGQEQLIRDKVETIGNQAETDGRHYRALASQGMSYWNSVIAKDKDLVTRLGPGAVDMGISFDKPRRMPMMFIKQISEYNAAIAEAEALEKTIDQFGGVGVTSGLTSFRWFRGTDAQNALAAIDKARQRIGKTLEGGVLRKEDEIKYKKILPTIWDAPKLAKFKLANLKETLARDKKSVIDAWETYGAGKEGSTGDEAERLMLEKAVIYGTISEAQAIEAYGQNWRVEGLPD